MNAENKNVKSSAVNIIDHTMDSLKELLGTNAVLGEKIEKDGMTIIPVSKISVGFAGGGADMTDAKKQKKQNPAGTGGKVSVTPLTFLVIDKDGARLLNITAAHKPSTVEQIIGAVFDKLKEMKTKKEYIIED